MQFPVDGKRIPAVQIEKETGHQYVSENAHHASGFVPHENWHSHEKAKHTAHRILDATRSVRR